MKKKIVIIGAVCVMTVIGVSLPKIISLADSGIMSKGTFTLQDGSEVAIYQEDFNYLQDEIDDLFQELPYRINDDSNELED